MTRAALRTVVAAAAVVAVVASLAVAYVWLTRSAAARPLRVAAAESGWTDVRVASVVPDAVARLDASGGLTLHVDEYLATGRPRAAVLLVHGNRPRGCAQPVYRVLARALADRDVYVAALDLRGFGRSDPLGPEPLEAGAFLEDVRRGMAFVAGRRPDVPAAVVGHSIGALLALAVDLDPPVEGAGPWRAVALEPGVDLAARVVAPGAPELGAFAAKLRRHVRGGAIDADVVRDLYDRLDPERPRSGRGGRRVVVQGARADRALVEGVPRIASAHPEAALAWTDTRDHEYGVRALAERVVYPSSPLDDLSSRIATFATGGDFRVERARTES